jgi:hypothetical protein
MNRTLKTVLFSVGVVSALLIAASAYAMATRTTAPKAAGDPFANIASASRSATAADALDVSTARWLRRSDAGETSAVLGTHLLAHSRRVGTVSDGRAVYLVPTTMNRLCVVLQRTAESCGNPLSSSSPITFTIVTGDASSASGPIAYGVAQDDVASVSFAVAGRAETLAVRDGVFSYSGRSGETAADFSAPTVTFKNGQSEIAK